MTAAKPTTNGAFSEFLLIAAEQCFPLPAQIDDELTALTGDGFDVLFEASGDQSALKQAFSVVRRGGSLVPIGVFSAPEVALPSNQLLVRALQFVGSFRYGNVWEEALRLVATGRVNVRPLISRVFPLAEVSQAFFLAADQAQALKVQIQIGNS